MPFREVDLPDQKRVLAELAKLVRESIPNPLIYEAARQITSDCTSRDEKCELQAIFDAVKNGTDKVKALQHGLRYVADPRELDYFTAPHKMLEMCADGACGGDCDDHAGLVAALCGALGYAVGVRAWGEASEPDYSHVYCVVSIPKRSPSQVLGMDTTVDESTVGWEPPGGRTLTAWLED